MTNERTTTDMSLAAQFHRLREAALREAEACEANGLNSGMNHAYGQSVAYAEAIRIVARSPRA